MYILYSKHSYIYVSSLLFILNIVYKIMHQYDMEDNHDYPTSSF